MANPKQLTIIRQGTDIWNEWRKQNPNIEINLSYINLTKTDLTRANLIEANLSYTNLREANLIRQELSSKHVSYINKPLLNTTSSSSIK